LIERFLAFTDVGLRQTVEQYFKLIFALVIVLMSVAATDSDFLCTLAFEYSREIVVDGVE